MYLLYALFILVIKLENLELLFSYIHPNNFWWCQIRCISLFCPHETAHFPNITDPFYNFVLLYIYYLQRRIFLLSVWPISLILRILSQMSPSIVGNTFFCAPTAILSFLWYSGIVIYLFTCLSDTEGCAIFQIKEHILYIFTWRPGCGMCIV